MILVAGVTVLAHADEAFPPVASEAVRYECSDCHIPYQPQMLPQRSWRRLMDGLADHFGEELSLDEETTQKVLRYLLDNSADRSEKKGARKFLRGLSSGDNPIRITDTPRWKEKHRELPESFWLDSRIAFKGECMVCHTKAERGLYDDDDGLRVPGPNETWSRWEDD
jgi:nitrate/TMAO reductase-like tetraheme cytochrome c subunit